MTSAGTRGTTADQTAPRSTSPCRLFHGRLGVPFDPRSTRDGEFHVSDTMTVTVPMMHHDFEFRHMRNGDGIGLDLPYLSRRWSTRRSWT